MVQRVEAKRQKNKLTLIVFFFCAPFRTTEFPFRIFVATLRSSLGNAERICLTSSVSFSFFTYTETDAVADASS